MDALKSELSHTVQLTAKQVQRALAQEANLREGQININVRNRSIEIVSISFDVLTPIDVVIKAPILYMKYRY